MAEPSTRTVERALALLATICDRGGANLADSARECDLAPSTALRLLRTLENTGFVTKEEVGGTYRPGSRLIQLGAQALSNESLIDSRQARDGEAGRGHRRVGVSQRRGTRAAPRCTSASSRAPTRSGTPAGSVEPFPSTFRRRGMRCAAASPTRDTSIVERGVEADVTAIACPVYSEARIVAALSLVVPSYRLTKQEAAQYGRMLASAAAALSARLSRRPKPALPEGQS